MDNLDSVPYAPLTTDEAPAEEGYRFYCLCHNETHVCYSNREWNALDHFAEENDIAFLDWIAINKDCPFPREDGLIVAQTEHMILIDTSRSARGER